ncbi:MAG TPA: FlgD immunoglobulin-like domain containing protein, partial [Candidatus Eisenbacteria bacterium]|nr:FlgD immunoglobulin-like domain containing protein [Candidatus Eisenbacteria bacterium]
NPFKTTTRIAYVVRGTGEHVHIGVYDVAGRRMKVLADGYQSPGRYELSWDGSSDAGARANNGVYFVRSVVAGKVQTMRVIYVK